MQYSFLIFFYANPILGLIGIDLNLASIRQLQTMTTNY